MLYSLWFDSEKEVNGLEYQLQQVQYAISESELVHRSELLALVLEMRSLLGDERKMKTSVPKTMTVSEAHEKLYPEWDS